MYKICIVDNEEGAVKLLEKMVLRYGQELKIDFSVKKYTCAEDYLDSADTDCDIMLLDVALPKINGMELAVRIRETNDAMNIIFCTKQVEYALMGYGVTALGFIVKPMQWKWFKFYFDKAVKLLARRDVTIRRSGRIQVKLAGRMEYIYARTILYVEVQKHLLYYYIKEANGAIIKTLPVRGVMKDAEAQLAHYGFCRCNTAFLVNLHYVDGVRAGYVHIGDIALPISRTRRQSFLSTLKAFMKEQI